MRPQARAPAGARDPGYDRRPIAWERAMASDSENPRSILDAMAYVDAVHKALAAANTAPPPGVEGRVVAAILADPALLAQVRQWAGARRVLEAGLEPPMPPPIDDGFRRVRDLLLAAAAGAG
jgi:hypothetical protein